MTSNADIPGSPTTAPNAGERVATLATWALLATGLGAILVFVYDLVIPQRSVRSVWSAPIVIASAAGLASLLLIPSGRAERLGKTIDGLALVLGVASMILGVGAAILIAVGISLHTTEDPLSSQTRLHRMTDPRGLVELLKFAGGAALPGILGIVIARWRRRATGRVSTAGAAWRFSVAGLVMAALIALAVGAAALYRWLTWGIR